MKWKNTERFSWNYDNDILGTKSTAAVLACCCEFIKHKHPALTNIHSDSREKESACVFEHVLPSSWFPAPEKFIDCTSVFFLCLSSAVYTRCKLENVCIKMALFCRFASQHVNVEDWKPGKTRTPQHSQWLRKSLFPLTGKELHARK